MNLNPKMNLNPLLNHFPYRNPMPSANRKDVTVMTSRKKKKCAFFRDDEGVLLVGKFRFFLDPEKMSCRDCIPICTYSIFRNFVYLFDVKYKGENKINKPLYLYSDLLL